MILKITKTLMTAAKTTTKKGNHNKDDHNTDFFVGIAATIRTL